MARRRKPNGRKKEKINGYEKVRRCCKQHDVEIRTCSTGHKMVGPLPDGSMQTVTDAREYGKTTTAKLTALFAGFGFIALLFVCIMGI